MWAEKEGGRKGKRRGEREKEEGRKERRKEERTHEYSNATSPINPKPALAPPRERIFELAKKGLGKKTAVTELAIKTERAFESVGSVHQNPRGKASVDGMR